MNLTEHTKNLGARQSKRGLCGSLARAREYARAQRQIPRISPLLYTSRNPQNKPLFLQQVAEYRYVLRTGLHISVFVNRQKRIYFGNTRARTINTGTDGTSVKEETCFMKPDRFQAGLGRAGIGEACPGSVFGSLESVKRFASSPHFLVT